MKHKISDSEKARAIFLAVYLRTLDERQAAKASGLCSRGTLKRIIHKLETDFTLADAPKAGRGVKFTDTILALAVSILEEHHEMLLSTPELVVELQDRGELPEPTDVDNFRQHLKSYLRQHNSMLVIGKTGTVFFISLEHSKQRVGRSRQLLAVITSKLLEELWVSDETAVGKGIIPKGMGFFCILHAAAGVLAYVICPVQSMHCLVPKHAINWLLGVQRCGDVGRSLWCKVNPHMAALFRGCALPCCKCMEKAHLKLPTCL